MIPVGEPQQVAIVIGIAALLGAIGGFGAELLLHNAAGRIERPRRLKASWDLGWMANVLLGAIAGTAILWLVPPGEMTSGGETIPAYDLRTVVGVSLVAGTAGGAILAALQERARNLALAKETEVVKEVAVSSLVSLRPADRPHRGDGADFNVSEAQLRTALASVKAAASVSVDGDD